ncbi:MAG: TMEM175 family protein, partial [Thermoplasmata archaeon]
ARHSPMMERPTGSDSEAAELAPPWEFRGTDLGRILALSDGVFGFALTLLVLTVSLPSLTSSAARPPLLSELASLETALLTYALGVVIIAGYWRTHVLVFTYLRRWDRTLIQANLLFLGMIALQPFLITMISEYSSSRAAVLLFCLVSIVTGLALAALWRYASSQHRLVAAGLDSEHIRYVQVSTLLAPAVFAISAAVSFVNVSIAIYCWAGVFLVTFVARRRAFAVRRPPAVLGEAAPAGAPKG